MSSSTIGLSSPDSVSKTALLLVCVSMYLTCICSLGYRFIHLGMYCPSLQLEPKSVHELRHQCVHLHIVSSCMEWGFLLRNEMHPPHRAKAARTRTVSSISPHSSLLFFSVAIAPSFARYIKHLCHELLQETLSLSVA